MESHHADARSDQGTETAEEGAPRGADTAVARERGPEADRKEKKRKGRKGEKEKGEGKGKSKGKSGGKSKSKSKDKDKGDAAQAGDGEEGHPRKMKGKEYAKRLRALQEELCYLQAWVKHAGLRVIIIFEGRDAAGKGGVIKAITERVSPRVFRLVALPAPSDREKSQMYIQRYMQHFPAAGEVVIFDRSWYNRAGVEHVMGFCTQKQYERFLEVCPLIEHMVVANGIILLKVWLEVSDEEQKRRVEARIDDPLRQWKLSPMDLPSRSKWYEYSRARDRMLEATDTPSAPWYVLRSDDKKRARLNCIRHILDHIPCKRVKREKVELPKRSKKGAYDDQASIRERRFVREVY